MRILSQREQFPWRAKGAGLNGDIPEGLAFQHHPDGFDPFPTFDPDDPHAPAGHKWVQFQEDLDYDEDEDDNSVPFYLAAPDHKDLWHVRGADSGFRYSDDELKIHDQLPPGVRPEMDIDSWPTVSAHDGDRLTGYLQWIPREDRDRKGEIRNIQVLPQYQRRGIGTALFDYVKNYHEPLLHHSDTVSVDGAAWSSHEQSRREERSGGDRMRILSQREQYPWRTAAVNQDLVDRLDGEFWDWAEANNVTNPYLRDDVEQERGAIGHWPSIERFLKKRYPAAHRGLEMGSEEARPMLDQPSAQTYAPLWGKDRYETGPDAVAQHGYDPKEIAAGMLLLHNQSHPLRGDLAQEDQDRLTDIFTKRQQMQRDYEQRQQP
jgi:GNAT superfamily N-acetyltransferase